MPDIPAPPPLPEEFYRQLYRNFLKEQYSKLKLVAEGENDDPDLMMAVLDAVEAKRAERLARRNEREVAKLERHLAHLERKKERRLEKKFGDIEDELRGKEQHWEQTHPGRRSFCVDRSGGVWCSRNPIRWRKSHFLGK